MNECPLHETLVALWAGELEEPQAATIDEHVFACDMCAAVTEGLARIVGMLREKLPFAISHAHRDRLVAAGARIRVTLLEATRDRKATQSARFTPDVDLLLFALRGDVSAADRVDVEITSPTGGSRHVLEDVPFDRSSGEVLIACRRHFEGMFPAGDPIFSVYALRAGSCRVVGEYVVTHVWR